MKVFALILILLFFVFDAATGIGLYIIAEDAMGWWALFAYILGGCWIGLHAYLAGVIIYSIHKNDHFSYEF